jgi:hypothetical protein
MNATKNQGEGNRAAANQYNESQKAFVKSGKVAAAAEDAKAAIEGSEAAELKEAENKGKSHARK